MIRCADTPTSDNPDLSGAARPARAILLVDDHELVRLGFRALVAARSGEAGEPPLYVLGATTLAEALQCYEQQRACIAVVVLDLNLPDTEGLSGLIRFRQACPQAPVVVLSGTASAQMAQDALTLGALAFFEKSGDLGAMLGFVHACAHADAPHPGGPRPHLAHPGNVHGTAFAGAHARRDALAQLTTRQLQILQWVLEGKSNREISEIAHLTEGTVKNHVSMLLLTFGVRSRTQLIIKLHA
ncbi:response regulator transcription factor [Comamonas flocculans]|uniref:Response regulator transcription factor n=1 Tax=Comamonas flocculans TaxID=2597701 RepID=A0A5B8RZD1_9BURK|nr:response regulator transcription factor [Comamonas flocculans]QEA14158.1 response regulator transcription factor [Comamonas flocculans]